MSNRERFLQEKREQEMREKRMELMREQVQEVELQARYWKAMHDTKYWTLEDNKLKESYEKYFVEVQQRAEDAAEQLEKISALTGNMESANVEDPQDYDAESEETES